MNQETKQILELISALAHEMAALEGGSHEGVLYTSATWRTRVIALAQLAQRLAEGKDEAR
jgi:hypothetical protein